MLKVLWIPHTPQHYLGWDGCRQFRLFEHLKDRVELHVISWMQRKSFRGARQWGACSASRTWYGTRHDAVAGPQQA